MIDKYFRKAFYLLILAALSASCSSETNLQNNSFEITSEHELDSCLRIVSAEPLARDANYAIWRYYTFMDRSEDLINHARPIFKMAEKKDMELFAYAGANIGQAFFFMGQKDSMLYYFDRIKSISIEENFSFPLIAIYNNMAMYEATYTQDYPRALEYMHKCLKVMEESGNMRNYANSLSNLASIYFEREDTAGLKYAMKAYKINKENRIFYNTFVTALMVSRFYLLTDEAELGLPYIKEALSIVESHTEIEHQYRVLSLTVYAEILSAIGNIPKAEEYYKKAISITDKNAMTPYGIMVYSSYGNMLTSIGEYRKALDYLSYIKEVAGKSGFTNVLPGICYNLSIIYSNMGKPEKAFENYKEYVAAKDSVYSIERERNFNRLVLKYENIRHEKEIQEQELELAKRTQYSIVIISILGVALIGASIAFYFSRKRNQLYRKLVEKDQEQLRTRNSPKETQKPEDDERVSPIPEEKGILLYNTISNLMQEKKLYRQNDISLEAIAELTDTNKWYVSRVINDYSGTSFNNYINRFRIDEAVETLSDTENDIPLKSLSTHLGYNSLSVFYKYFQQRTGVPPSKYREEVRRLSKNR